MIKYNESEEICLINNAIVKAMHDGKCTSMEFAETAVKNSSLKERLDEALTEIERLKSLNPLHLLKSPSTS